VIEIGDLDHARPGVAAGEGLHDRRRDVVVATADAMELFDRRRERGFAVEAVQLVPDVTERGSDGLLHWRARDAVDRLRAATIARGACLRLQYAARCDSPCRGRLGRFPVRAEKLTPGRGLFVTGTDTGVGKTVVAAALLRGLVADGVRALGMKPVAAGIEPGRSRNADVDALVAAGNVAAPLADVNPYAFDAPIAPHLAAARSGTVIDLERIASAYGRLAARADAVVVEGAGGALVPLSRRSDMLDIAARLGLPVLLVVGVRLGCLNHALLTALAISARGLRLVGWVANRIDAAMPEAEANVETLARLLPAPLIADLPWHGAATGAPPIRGAIRLAFVAPG